MNRYFYSIVSSCLALGLNAQEKPPLFLKGDQVKAKDADPVVLAPIDDGSWRGKKFWFIPNLKTSRSLRVGFASSLSSDDLEEKSLLYPTDVVCFTVIDIERSNVPYKGDRTTTSNIEFYKVQFEDGSYAYLERHDSSYKVSRNGVKEMENAKSWNNDLDLLSSNFSPYTTETFFREDPKLMAKRYQEAQKEAMETETREKAEEFAADKKRRAAAAAFKARGGVKIGMTKAQVLASNWGRPSKMNRTTNANGEHEQWVYGGNNYLYFDNGILTSIQN